MVAILRSWIEPRLGPRRVQIRARKRDAIVQAERPLLPELDLGRHDAVARPEWRPRPRAAGELCGVERDCLLERQAAFQRGGLLRGPGADLRHARAGAKIGVGFLLRHWRD